MQKSLLRKKIKDILACINKLLEIPEFQSCNFVSVYVSMSSEFQTKALLQAAFDLKKHVFLPKVTGKRSEDMQMVEVESMEAIMQMVPNSWGIREPNIPSPDYHAIHLGSIDFVVVPGVAFDVRGNRLGHGKGYYDCFIRSLRAYYQSKNWKLPVICALCLNEQLVEQIPTEPHDQTMDLIITPTAIYDLRTTATARP